LKKFLNLQQIQKIRICGYLQLLKKLQKNILLKLELNIKTEAKFQNNKIFTLSDLENNYHVKYTYRKINDNQTEMEYFEWMTNGELTNPFTYDIIQKLKSVMESN